MSAHKPNPLINYILVCLLSLAMFGCTEKQPQVWVTQLEVFPKTFSIKTNNFNANPFTVRARYSNDEVKNVSKEIRWMSEDVALIKVTAEGKLEKHARCLQPICIVSLIATHPESGQVHRVELRLFAENNETQQVAKKPDTVDSRKAANSTEQISPSSEEDEESHDVSDSGITQEPEVNGNSVVLTESVEKEHSLSSSRPNASNKKDAREIRFAQAEAVIESGDSLSPQVMFSAAEFIPSKPTEDDFSCQVQFSDTNSILLENHCTIRALAPGKAAIKLIAKAPNHSRDSIFNINIVAKSLEYALVNGFRLDLGALQNQTWITVKHIPVQTAHRFNVQGLHGLGAQLYVFQSIDSNRGCLNTVPNNSREVSCIVKPIHDQVHLILRKPEAILNVIELRLEPVADELLAYGQLNNSARPQALLLEHATSAFILANESGSLGQHFYKLDLQDESERGSNIKVVLQDFSEPPGLEIFWDNGYCAGNSLPISTKQVYCDLPQNIIGNVRIIINASTGDGVANGLVAKKGGTYYTLLATKR